MAKLGDIASVVTKGTTPTSLGFAFENEGINFIKIESIEEDGSFIKEKFGHISEECDRALSRSRLQENDILFSIAGAIGRTAIVTSEILPANTNQALAIIRIPKGKIDYKFLDYALHSGAIVDQFEKKKQGVAQLNISLADVRSFQIPDISIQEQSRIVAILGKVDRLISLRKKQLQKLDDLVKSRFVEMFGDPITNSNNLPMKKLGEICELKAGDFTAADDIHDLPSEENPYPCYGGNGIRGYVDNYTQKGEYPIIGRQGALCGNVQYATGKFRNTEHAVLVTPTTPMNGIWLFQLLKLEDLYRFHTGAAQPGLAVKTLNMVSVPVADTQAQNRFSKFYSQVEESKLTVQQGLDKLELLKQSLMQKYFG